MAPPGDADAGRGPPAWCSIAFSVDADTVVGKPLGRGNLKTSPATTVARMATRDTEDKCIFANMGRKKK